MKVKPKNFLAILFGPIGDALMALALFNDVLTIEPEATLLVLTRRNVGLIRDLARAYPQITVQEIPGGAAAIPFFTRLLMRRWVLLTLGVSGVYSMRLKLFFLALRFIPGNRTVGFNDRLPGERGWLPLQVVLQFDGSQYIIDNFRRLLPYVFGEERTRALFGRPPQVHLATELPKGFSLQPGHYIATNLASVSSHRSLPMQHWKRLLPKIASAYPGSPLLMLGGPADVEFTKELARAVPGAIAMPGLPLLEAAGVINGAALYIGVDTGITHLAGVMQQKSLILSHFRFPTWLPTYNPNARALANSKRCECNKGGRCIIIEDGKEYSYCMYDISDEAVLESVHLALSSPARSVPLFAGFVDENSAQGERKDDSQNMCDEVAPEPSK